MTSITLRPSGVNWIWFIQERKVAGKVVKIVVIIDLLINNEYIIDHLDDVLADVFVLLNKQGEKLSDYLVIMRGFAWYGISFKSLMTGAPTDIHTYELDAGETDLRGAINDLIDRNKIK